MKQKYRCPNCHSTLWVDIVSEPMQHDDREALRPESNNNVQTPPSSQAHAERGHETVIRRPAAIAFIREWLLAIVGMFILVYPTGTISLILSSDAIDALLDYPLLLTGIRTAGFFIVAYYIGKILLTILSSRYTFSASGVQAANGIIKRTNSSIQYQHIQSVDIKQGYIERMLDVGNIYMATAGTSEAEVEILKVANPMRLQQLIEGRMR